MSVPDELRRYVPRTDLYDSLELVHYHMPVEQPPATASYIIFKKGNKTYAKNGTYGHIEYENIDSANVINNALANLSDGGIIYIKQGQYIISDTISVGDNIAIIGEGMDITTLKLADNTNKYVLENADQTNGNTNIRIENLTIDCNGAQQSAASCLHFKMVGSSMLRRIKVKNGYSYTVFWESGGTDLNKNNIITDCIFDTSNAGGTGTPWDLAVFGRFIDSIINNCWFINGAGYGLSTRNMRNTVIKGCICTGNNYGIGLESVENIKISDCICHDNNRNGIIIIDVDNTPNKRITIQNCLIIDNGQTTTTDGHGIVIRNGYDVTVRGCICSGNGLEGISFVGIQGGAIVGNICKNNNQRGVVDAGIALKSTTIGLAMTTYDIQVVGNRCYDDQATKTQEYGIYEYSPCDYNIIVANNCRGNATGGITTSGTNTISANNIT